MNYQKKCPRCRRNIDMSDIFLYQNNKSKGTIDLKDHVDNIFEDLGTKISNLIKLVLQIKKESIIFQLSTKSI